MVAIIGVVLIAGDEGPGGIVRAASGARSSASRS
jgi:hypothetical protein